ncbi:MAG: hypothetical protein AAF483_06070 [Planctomycetota bacterium]
MSSNKPDRIIAGCVLGTLVITGVSLLRIMQNEGEFSFIVLLIAMPIATALGCAIGCTVVGYQKYRQLRANNRAAPWFYRLFFDGQPLKLILAVPMLAIVSIVVAAIAA